MMSRIRIITGLVLFLFVFGHLLNLAFGLVSIEAMENARPIFMGLWSNPIGGMVLLISFLTHAGLGLWTLYQRNTLLMNWRDGGQALLGLAIIPLLLPHIMGVAVGPAMTGMQPTFTWVLAVYWMFAPTLGIQQVLALIVVWVHGCYGLLLWLQIQERVGWMAGLVWPLVVAVPVSALLGFVEAGKFLYAHREDVTLMAEIRRLSEQYEPVAAQLWNIHDTILWIYGAIVVVVLAARLLRIRRQADLVEVRYPGTTPIRRIAGLSLLELARFENVEHAGLCGARGRCGSCAVRVLQGAENLSSIESQEASSLARTHAAEGTRLACQAKPTGGVVEVERIFDSRLLPSEYRSLVQKQRMASQHPVDPESPPPDSSGDISDVSSEARA